jgi:hypothetical protein
MLLASYAITKALLRVALSACSKQPSLRNHILNCNLTRHCYCCVAVPTEQGDRLPESNEGVCEALALMTLGEAQQMAVGKALATAATGGKATPNTLLARLCMGVVQLLDQCLTVLKSKVRQLE